MRYDSVGFISYFRGESANNYATHKEYVEAGAWAQDFLFNWLETWGADEFPSLDRIGDFCHKLQENIDLWHDGVIAGAIDPEAGVEN